MAEPSPFGAGLEAGRVAQVLKEHSEHFIDLNGSMDKTAAALVELASEVRQLREDARLREERVEVAATTLATETERRREELAGTVDSADRAVAQNEYKFTRRERIGAAVLTVAIALVGYKLR